jgi:hypothetical protein
MGALLSTRETVTPNFVASEEPKPMVPLVATQSGTLLRPPAPKASWEASNEFTFHPHLTKDEQSAFPVAVPGERNTKAGDTVLIISRPG